MDTMTTISAPVLTRRKFELSRLSGLAFLALTAAAIALLPTTTPFTDSTGDYADYYAGDHPQVMFAMFLAPLGAVFFLWMLARLSLVLDATPARLPHAVIQPAGLLFLCGWLSVVACATATTFALEVVDDFAVDPTTAALFDTLVACFFQVMMAAAAALGWSVALAGQRSGRLSGWMLWVGVILAPLALIGWMLFMLPLALLLIWLAVISARPLPESV